MAHAVLIPPVHMNSIKNALTGCVLVTAVATSAFGLGFRNPDQNAVATAQGEAFVAQADNASALYYNPAGLTQIHDTEGCGGGLITTRDIKFQGAAANEGVNDPAYTVQMFGASNFGLSNLTVGVGTYIPFGNVIDWGNRGTFKYQITESGLTVQDYALGVAYRFCENFSFGAAFNYYNADTYLRRLVPFSLSPLLPPGTPDGEFRFAGDGQAFGATVGAMFKLNDQHQIGVVYRSPYAINFKGHAVVRRDATGGAYARSDASAEIQFPQQIAVGYAFRPTPKLKLEVDVEWTDWDTLNTVQLHSSNPAFANDPNSKIPFHWKSSFFYEAGAEYRLNEMWALRAGYIFSENSVPSGSFSPNLPDSNRHIFSVGAGWAWKHFGLDLTYQYSLSTTRKINGSADTNFDGQGDLDGKWTSQGHAVSLTSSLRF